VMLLVSIFVMGFIIGMLSLLMRDSKHSISVKNISVKKKKSGTGSASNSLRNYFFNSKTKPRKEIRRKN
jgi:hypothetical protein